MDLCRYLADVLPQVVPERHEVMHVPVRLTGRGLQVPIAGPRHVRQRFLRAGFRASLFAHHPNAVLDVQNTGFHALEVVQLFRTRNVSGVGDLVNTLR